MDFPTDQIEELKALATNVLKCDEGNVTYFLLKGLQLPDGCSPTIADALLCPTERDGYPSRLFFSIQFGCPKQQNWNSCNIRILEQNWFAFSWRINRSGLRLAQMVSAHLGAFI